MSACEVLALDNHIVTVYDDIYPMGKITNTFGRPKFQLP